MRNKSGQSSFEYLSTYGWAMLAIVVAVGALSYFGILNPSALTPDRCTVTTGFSCLDYKLSKWRSGATESEVDILLRNDLDYPITITGRTNITCPDCVAGYQQGNVACGMYGWPPPINTISLNPGESVKIICNPGGGSSLRFVRAGAKGKVFFEFDYVKSQGVYSHKVRGEIYAKIQSQ